MGIDVGTLKNGISLYVNTNNTLYHLYIVESNIVIVHGGKYFPTPTEVTFVGSLNEFVAKFNWIDYGLRMKFLLHSGKTVITSPVTKAKISGDNWHYDMEWE